MTADLKKPNKERLLATMRGEIPDRVPHYEILLEARNVKAILGKDVGTTMAASRGTTADALYARPLAAEYFAQICASSWRAAPETSRWTSCLIRYLAREEELIRRK